MVDCLDQIVEILVDEPVGTYEFLYLLLGSATRDQLAGDVAPTGDGIATFVDIEETGDAWQRVGDEWESAT